MQRLALFLLSAALAVALAEAYGQYYVPRAYYTIDSAGHASAPVPLQRLRRSFYPGAGASANAEANANSYGGGSASAQANANAYSEGGYPGSRFPGGSWGLPGSYGAARPLRAGMTRRQFGDIQGGRSVAASSSVGLDSNGYGTYNMDTSVGG